MSGNYPRVLKRRAEAMLKNVVELFGKGEYDLVTLNAEYAAQPYLKAILYQLTGEEWRGHSIRSLLGVLAFVARENGLEDIVDEIHDFARKNKRVLAELDEAHIRAVYGVFGYTREQAETLISMSRQVIDMAKRIIKSILG